MRAGCFLRGARFFGAIGLECHRLLVGQPTADNSHDRALADLAVGDGPGADFLDHHPATGLVERGDAQLRAMLREEVQAANPGVDGPVPLFQLQATGDHLLGEEPAGGVGGRIVAFHGLQHEVTEASFDPGDDSAQRGLVTGGGTFVEIRGEKFVEPGDLDRGAERQVGRHLAARLDLVDLGRHEEPGLTDG